MRLSGLLPQLFFHFAATSAILGIALATNVASAKSILPTQNNITSASSYRSIRPPDPPGFRARVWQPKPEPSNLLHPLGVYFSVLIYFHQRGQKQGWTQPAELEIYKVEPTRINIAVERFEHADPSVPALNLGHVMLALYAGVVHMSETRRFYSTKIEVSVFETPIGVLWILGMGRVGGGTQATTAQLISNRSSIEDDVPDSGVYTDPLVPGMQLAYRFAPRKVISEDLFTCLMEAFLITTSQGKNAAFTYLDAVSAAPRSRLVLNIHHTTGRHHVPSNGAVGDLLWLMAQFYASGKRFEEMEFDMRIKAASGSGDPPWERAAEGFFFRVGGGDGVALA